MTNKEKGLLWDQESDIGAKCPERGAELSFTGGCNICPSCGFSKCD